VILLAAVAGDCQWCTGRVAGELRASCERGGRYAVAASATSLRAFGALQSPATIRPCGQRNMTFPLMPRRCR